MEKNMSKDRALKVHISALPDYQDIRLLLPIWDGLIRDEIYAMMFDL